MAYLVRHIHDITKQQVEAFAIEKWGSQEKMDEEFYRREQDKKERKDKKYKLKMLGKCAYAISFFITNMEFNRAQEED